MHFDSCALSARHSPLFMQVMKCLRHLAEEDKRLHMRWSFFMTLACLVVWPPFWAAAVVLTIGFFKESWDARYGSGFCLYDMLANLLGILGAVTVAACLPPGVFSG